MFQLFSDEDEGSFVGEVSSATAAGTPPLRVLCVDDNHDVADSTAALLRIVGFDVTTCYDGPSALLEAREFHPGVCLIDLNMPEMDGDVLAVRLREQSLGSPLVLVALTAMNDEKSCRRIRDAGFDLHLVKPVDPFKLMSVVDALWQAFNAAVRHG